MGKVLGWVGGVVTTLWLGGIALYSSLHWELIWALGPNEWGDFLGGSMGPLALTWLVLGYLQQGIELRQNGQALNMQAEELKHAVDQYKEMARVANEQLKQDVEASARALAAEAEARRRHKASIQPRFAFSLAGGSHSNVSDHKFAVVNPGAIASDVTLSFTDGTRLGLPRVASWGHQELREIRFETERSPAVASKELLISYRDSEGDASSVIFDVVFVDSGAGYSTPTFQQRSPSHDAA